MSSVPASSAAKPGTAAHRAHRESLRSTLAAEITGVTRTALYYDIASKGDGAITGSGTESDPYVTDSDAADPLGLIWSHWNSNRPASNGDLLLRRGRVYRGRTGRTESTVGFGLGAWGTGHRPVLTSCTPLTDLGTTSDTGTVRAYTLSDVADVADGSASPSAGSNYDQAVAVICGPLNDKLIPRGTASGTETSGASGRVYSRVANAVDVASGTTGTYHYNPATRVLTVGIRTGDAWADLEIPTKKGDCITTTADLAYVRDIAIVGWGLGSEGYGIRLGPQSSAGRAMAERCISQVNGFHNIGSSGNAGSSRILIRDCEAAWCEGRSAGGGAPYDGTNFVIFSPGNAVAASGAELHAHRLTCGVGPMPGVLPNGGSPVITPCYSHAAGSNLNAWACIEDLDSTLGAGTYARPCHVDSVPSLTDARTDDTSQHRGFVIAERLSCKGRNLSASGFLNFAVRPQTIRLDSVLNDLEVTDANANNTHMTTARCGGLVVNTYFDFRYTATSMSRHLGPFGFPAGTQADNIPAWFIHCHFDWRVEPTIRQIPCLDIAYWSGGAGAEQTAYLTLTLWRVTNCLFTVSARNTSNPFSNAFPNIPPIGANDFGHEGCAAGSIGDTEGAAQFRSTDAPGPRYGAGGMRDVGTIRRSGYAIVDADFDAGVSVYVDEDANGNARTGTPIVGPRHATPAPAAPVGVTDKIGLNLIIGLREEGANGRPLAMRATAYSGGVNAYLANFIAKVAEQEPQVVSIKHPCGLQIRPGEGETYTIGGGYPGMMFPDVLPPSGYRQDIAATVAALTGAGVPIGQIACYWGILRSDHTLGHVRQFIIPWVQAGVTIHGFDSATSGTNYALDTEPGRILERLAAEGVRVYSEHAPAASAIGTLINSGVYLVDSKATDYDNGTDDAAKIAYEAAERAADRLVVVETTAGGAPSSLPTHLSIAADLISENRTPILPEVIFNLLTAGSGPVAPLVTRAQRFGTSIVLKMSRAVEVGTGGSGGFAMSGVDNFTVVADGDEVILTARNGSNVPIEVPNATLSYTQPGNGIEADDDGTDLASFTGLAVSEAGAGTGLTLRNRW